MASLSSASARARSAGAIVRAQAEDGTGNKHASPDPTSGADPLASCALSTAAASLLVLAKAAPHGVSTLRLLAAMLAEGSWAALSTGVALLVVLAQARWLADLNLGPFG
jgi:hypothetical protein